MSDRIRMSGLATGMDTDQTVKDMMKIEQARLDKLQSEKTVKEWTRDAYRDMNTAITEFKDKYLDVLNKDNYLKSPSTFTTNKATSSTSFDNILSVSNNENVDPKTRIVTIKQKASSGEKESSILSKNYSLIESTKDIDRAALKPGFSFVIAVDGKNRKVTLDTDLSASTDTEIKDEIQSIIDDAVGTYQDGGVTKSKIEVEFTANRFKFNLSAPMQSSTIEFKNEATSYSEKVGLDFEEKNYVKGTASMADFNGNFVIQEHGGVATNVSVSGASDANAMITSINSQLDAVYGGRVKASIVDGDKLTFSTSGSGETFQLVEGTSDDLLAKAGIENNSNLKPLEGKVSFGYDDENQKLKFNIDGVTKEITLSKNYASSERGDMQNEINTQLAGTGISVNINAEGAISFSGDADIKIEVETVNNLESLGFEQSKIGNKMDLNSSIEELFNKGVFANDDIPYNSAGEIEFKLNDNTIVLKAEDSINDLIKIVKDAKTDVELKYNEYTDKLTFVTKNMGTTASLELSDTKGNLMQTLGIDTTKVYGKDAIMNLDNSDDGTANGVDIYRDSNNFKIDGITYDIKSADPTKEVMINVESDTTSASETIKTFVKDYNALIGAMHTKLGERRYRDYKPLTSEQKKALGDDDTKAWELKAKSGLLRSDPILSGFVEKLRTAVYNKVDGVSLADIGITTSTDYREKGKLVINDTKLQNALNANGTDIASLFNFNEEGTEMKGIAYQLDDLIKEVSGTTGTKGKLLQKAGMKGDRTQTDNIIYKEIEEYDKRIQNMIKAMKVKEENYYKKFSSLEVAMNKMNQQSSWLTQQLGGM